MWCNNSSDVSRKLDVSLENLYETIRKIVQKKNKNSWFCFFTAHSRCFRSQSAARIKGKEASAKSFRIFNPKIRAFKHVLDFTGSIGGQKGRPGAKVAWPGGHSKFFLIWEWRPKKRVFGAKSQASSCLDFFFNERDFTHAWGQRPQNALQWRLLISFRAQSSLGRHISH